MLLEEKQSISFTASAPGSLMLFGEHAVLEGKLALVAAIDQRITVTIAPRADEKIVLESALGQYQTSLRQYTIAAPFQFVLTSLQSYVSQLPAGCNIIINSEFSAQIGFGSSAAVTVATLAAINAWLNLKLTQRDLLTKAIHVIQQVQGTGSGADVAASVYGGLVSYQMRPLHVEQIPVLLPLVVFYCGFKTPTPKVIQVVQTKFTNHSRLFTLLVEAMGQCSIDAVSALRENNWQQVGELMQIQQGLLVALGVSLPIMQDLVAGLQAQSSIVGAKISGSGLGDCVVGLGTLNDTASLLRLNSKVQHFPISMTGQGVMCEKE